MIPKSPIMTRIINFLVCIALNKDKHKTLKKSLFYVTFFSQSQTFPTWLRKLLFFW